jgi:energy-coupling factor transporter ATP-binding protein EcfA2
VIRFDRFSFSYWERSTPALRNVTLHVEEGECVLVAGPSGSGKSTLARCMNGLIPHFHGGVLSGRVTVDGLDVSTTQPGELATRVGMVFQDPENQLVATDVERDIAFGPENLGLPPAEIAARVEDALAALALTPLRHRLLASLSGGEKQRAAIAGVLALQPRMLVLDEPCSELDPAAADDFLAVLGRLRSATGLGIVLIEHRIERVAGFVDRVVLMDRGEIVADGRPADVLGSSLAGRLGIGLPPVTRLALELRTRGAWDGVVPVTVADARNSLGPVLRTLRGVRDCRMEPPAGPVVAVSSLSYRYDGSTGCALTGVEAAMCDGKVYAVMGRNGSGKTTLMKHLNGLLRPAAGSVSVAGVDVSRATVAEMSRTVGLVFQNPNDHLFADTVDDEVRFTLRRQGLTRDSIDARVREVLALLGLEALRREYPRSLSGGERQRVALASVLAARPRVLVLDEPTRGMEAGLKQQLSALLRDYVREGNLVIVVTHDVETVVEHVDRVLLLSGGHVEGQGTTRDVLDGHPVFASQVNRLMRGLSNESGRVATVADVLEALT